MKHFAALVLSFCFASFATAKTKVDVTVNNASGKEPCAAVEPWKKDIHEAFKQQLIHSLNETGLFNVVEPELYRSEQREGISGVTTVHKKRTFKAAQYSVQADLTSFAICEDAKKQDAEVVLEFKVIDVASGDVAHKFIARGTASETLGTINSGYKGAAFNSGLFRDSPIGQAAKAAITEATAKMSKAFPEAEVATNGYEVKTIRKPRSR